jgi:hypothetical protein
LKVTFDPASITIFVLTALPPITDTVYMHGTLQTVLEGGRATGGAPGLLVRAHNNTVIESLTVRNFPFAGMYVESGSYHVFRSLRVNSNYADGFLVSAPHTLIVDCAIFANLRIGILAFPGAFNITVQNNIVGLSPSGTSIIANRGDGVQIQSNNALIGGPTYALGNAVSGNLGAGISVFGTNATVMSNYIGTDYYGNVALPNTGIGLLLNGNFANVKKNLVSGNDAYGIVVAGHYSVLLGNKVGVNAKGSEALPNKNHGVYVKASFAVVGDISPGDGNQVSGNELGGILSAGTGNVFRGNKIGTDYTGSFAIANGYDGIVVMGMETLVERNIIAGNDRIGVFVQATNVTVRNNYVGINANSTAAVPNANHGVYVQGTGCVVHGNVLSGNGLAGIFIGISRTVVTGNVIGLNFYGNISIGNGANGIEIGIPDVTIGGTLPGEGNLIAANNQNGILASYARIAIFGNRIGTDITGTIGFANKGSGVVVAGPNIQIGGLESGQKTPLQAHRQPE